MFRKLTRCAALGAAVLAAGCATRTQTIDTSVEVFGPIRYSPEDTCATQKRIAEHNSVYDTLKSGERVVYAAPCELEEKSGDGEKVAQAGAMALPQRAPKGRAERPTGRRPEGRNRRTSVRRNAKEP